MTPRTYNPAVTWIARHKAAFKIAGLALVVFSAFGGWLSLRYLETKSAACECGNPVDGQRFALWNPFRDRSAERVAIEVVGAEKAGQCVTLSTGSPYCPEVHHSTVTSWKLTGREAKDDWVTLRFWVTRPDHDLPESGDPLWVTMQRQGEVWRVDHVDTYY